MMTTKPDSDYVTSYSKAPIDRSRSETDVLQLLHQVEKAKDLTPGLIRKLVDLSPLFTLEAVGRTLFHNDYPKFEQLLTTIKLTDGLSDKQLVGLCFAMALSSGDAFEALPTLVKNVPKERLDGIRF